MPVDAATDGAAAAEPPAGRLGWATAGLAAALLLPSTAVVQRYLHTIGLLAYLIIAAAALILLVRRREPLLRWAARLPERRALWLAALTFAVVVAVFLATYPLTNAGAVRGGSDSDDALDVAAAQLLHGRYPYAARTYLDNPISPLPGAILLAAPFVLLGASAYQNLFWLALFYLALRAYLKDGRSPLLLLWTALALSPAVWHQIVTGTDYLANSLYVLLFMLWLIRAAAGPAGRDRRAILFAILLGVGLSSRANFLLLLPLLFAALARLAGPKAAARYVALSGLSFLAVTLPFFLHDPAGFSPLHTTDELGRFDVVLPHAGVWISAAAAALAGVLAFCRRAWPTSARPQAASARSDAPLELTAALLRNSALVLALPVVCGIILYSLGLRLLYGVNMLYFGFASFGVFFLFFGATPAWWALFPAGRMPASLPGTTPES